MFNNIFSLSIFFRELRISNNQQEGHDLSVNLQFLQMEKSYQRARYQRFVNSHPIVHSMLQAVVCIFYIIIF